MPIKLKTFFNITSILTTRWFLKGLFKTINFYLLFVIFFQNLFIISFIGNLLIDT